MGRQRQVGREAFACAAADLSRCPGARIERILMQRDKQHMRVVVERILRAVAVMHVPIDDRDAFQAARARGGRCKRHVVQQAKAHARARHSVVTGWPEQREAALTFARCQQPR